MPHNIQFHIECGGAAGMGRVRRSLVLAQALWAKDATCFINFTDPAAHDLCYDFGFFPEEAPQLSDIDLNIIDAGTAYRDECLHTYDTKTCVIDDIGIYPCKADILINPNLYADTLAYSGYDIKYILDAKDHHLIDPSFFSAGGSAQVKDQILVSFGGTDVGQFAGPIIRALMAKTDLPIIWAKANKEPLPSMLTKWISRTLQITVMEMADMPVLLQKSSLYIGAAGTTSLEAVAAGVKITVCAVADDQQQNVKCLSGMGYAALDDFNPDLMTTLGLNVINDTHINTPITKDGPYLIADEIIKYLKGEATS